MPIRHGILVATVQILLLLFISDIILVRSGSVASTKRSATVFSWMHIQKTSSWLGDFLFDWSCDRLPSAAADEKRSYGKRSNVSTCTASIEPRWDVGHHQPFSKHEGMKNHTIVSVFRAPVSRLVSAFLFDRGGMLPMGFPDKFEGDTEKRTHDYVLNSRNPIGRYAKLPGIPSCQAKMVLGKPCGAAVVLSEADIAEAERRLERDDFAFIGLAEDYTANIALFVAKFGEGKLRNNRGSDFGVMPNTIRQNAEHTPEIDAKLRADLRESGWEDVAEERVYSTAKRVFCLQCKEYNISTVVDCRVDTDERSSRSSGSRSSSSSSNSSSIPVSGSGSNSKINSKKANGQVGKKHARSTTEKQRLPIASTDPLQTEVARLLNEEPHTKKNHHYHGSHNHNQNQNQNHHHRTHHKAGDALINNSSSNNSSSNNKSTSAPTMHIQLPSVISWMHIQKTSHWVGQFLADMFCNYTTDKSLKNSSLLNLAPRYNLQCVVELEPRDQFGYHRPYADLREEDTFIRMRNGTIVTIFREPVARLISAFLFDNGGMLPAGSPFHFVKGAEKETHEKILNATRPIVAYAQTVGIASCATKMVMGMWCGEEVKAHRPLDINEAKRRLREDFLFVGLLEDSFATKSLFMAMFGPPKTGVQVEHVLKEHERVRQNEKHSSAADDALRLQLKESGWRDPYDEELYATVVEIFCARCALYHVKTSIDCPAVLPGVAL